MITSKLFLVGDTHHTLINNLQLFTAQRIKKKSLFELLLMNDNPLKAAFFLGLS